MSGAGEVIDAFIERNGGSAAALKKIEPSLPGAHPLTRFVEPEPKVFTQPEFILDGLIEAGTVLVAGSAGAGKSTSLVPLVCRAAHLCRQDDPLRPLLRRVVVYIAEDIQQVHRILRSMRCAGEFEGISKETVAERFKLVDAQRMSAAAVVKAADEFAALATLNTNPVTGKEHLAQALIVFDTRSAVLEVESENDNSEASAAIATLRQGLPNSPLLIVGHIAKALSRSDVKNLSGRGAGAWEDNVQQVLYLVKDDTVTRWLDIAEPKHRFVARADGIEFVAHRTSAPAVDQLGNPVEVQLLHGKPTIVGLGERSKAKAEMREQANAEADKAMRSRVIDQVKTAMNLRQRVNKQWLRDKIGGKSQVVLESINRLLVEDWLVEIAIPVSERDHHKKTSYLVYLDFDQRVTYQATGAVPPEALIAA